MSKLDDYRKLAADAKALAEYNDDLSWDDEAILSKEDRIELGGEYKENARLKPVILELAVALEKMAESNEQWREQCLRLEEALEEISKYDPKKGMVVINQQRAIAEIYNISLTALEAFRKWKEGK